ncbi:hypothetical protein GGS21DRAFT_538365 [Xylaria nigripes]|nr:hypothetical protein GGS21DRAFT_538365 [Xylaria nigripes]
MPAHVLTIEMRLFRFQYELGTGGRGGRFPIGFRVQLLRIPNDKQNADLLRYRLQTLPPRKMLSFSPASISASKTYEILSRELEPDAEPVRANNLQLASLGNVELASREKDMLRLEGDVITKEQDAGLINPHTADKSILDVKQRHLSAGDALWKNSIRKVQRYNALEKKTKIPRTWQPGGNSIWCHVSGTWYDTDFVKAVYLEPSFFNEETGELVFGNCAESLEKAGNSLLLLNDIEKRFDSYYHLVIVSINPNETRSTRWRLDIISDDIEILPYDLQRQGLEGYLGSLPSVTPIPDARKKYITQAVLLAIATHFKTSEMSVVESWITENEFASPPRLADDEATEAARQDHMAVEAAISGAEKASQAFENSDEEDERNSEEEGEV